MKCAWKKQRELRREMRRFYAVADQMTAAERQELIAAAAHQYSR